MTDSDFPSISILNRASLAALGERLGMALAMERFRGNLWLDGLAPFASSTSSAATSGSAARPSACASAITRCKATTVDPATGVSDADTLGALQAGWGHQDFGVYAEVVAGGGRRRGRRCRGARREGRSSPLAPRARPRGARARAAGSSPARATS